MTINYGTVHGTNEHGLFELRMERDRLLIKSDWTQGDDVPVGIKTSYTTYRQKLRDLPSTSTPIIDTSSPTGISSVTWPTLPS